MNEMKEKFENAKLCPSDWLPQAPENFLNVLFESGAKVKLGNLIKPFQASKFPCLMYWPVNFALLYTVVIVDVDWPNKTSLSDSFLHFLACNVHANDIFKGDILADYLQPIPNAMSIQSPHRIVLLVYEQKQYSPTSEHRLLSNQLGNRHEFNLKDFCAKYSLTRPTFGNFFITQHDSQVDKCMQSLERRN